jgi:hypothetical protein
MLGFVGGGPPLCSVSLFPPIAELYVKFSFAEGSSYVACGGGCCGLTSVFFGGKTLFGISASFMGAGLTTTSFITSYTLGGGGGGNSLTC